MSTFTLSQLDLFSLANSASQREIGLLVELRINLERCPAAIIRYLMHRVDNRFDVVLLAPNCRSESSGLTVESRNRLLVLSGSFDGRDIEPELVSRFEGTRDVEGRVAVVAIDTSAFVVADPISVILVLAKLAYSFVLAWGDHLEALGDRQCLCVTESDLRCEECAVHMYPVVACSRLQGFSW